MWEGMERFMKAVDLIGKSNIELKTFQYQTESQLQRHSEKLEADITKAEHAKALRGLQETIEEKMNAQYHILDDRIKKLGTKTTERDDALEKMIKELESNTFWKVKDIEKLLEARPTIEVVKEVCQKECLNTLVNARQYTDDEIQKMKNGEAALVKQFEAYKLRVNGEMREFERQMRDSEAQVNKIDEDMRDMIESKERSLLTKIDEIRHNQEKILERLNRMDDDGESVAQSVKIAPATVIA